MCARDPRSHRCRHRAGAGDRRRPGALVLMIAFAVLVGAPLTVPIEVKRHLRRAAK